VAKITKLPGLEVVKGFKGTLDFYVWKGTACVRSWPRSPGRKRAPAVEAQWTPFSEATKLWGMLSPEVQDAYIAMSKGTNLTGRDMSVKLYLTNLSIVRL